MRWTGRAYVPHRQGTALQAFLTLVFLSLPSWGFAQEKTPLFIDEVRFKGAPSALKEQVPLWGSALAAEVSGVLRDLATHTPLTLQNLESQLGKEERKASMACSDASCISRIVENFGISESVFGVVTWLGSKKVQVTLVHTAGDEKLGEATPMYATPEYDAVAQSLRAMAGELFVARGKAARLKEARIGGEVEEWIPEKKSLVLVTIETTPPGALVEMDGNVLCQATPCSEAIPVGRHRMTMKMKEYVTRVEAVEFDKNRSFTWELEPDFAWLTVETKPGGLGVVVDDQELGSSPLTRRKVSPGGHRILLRSPCFFESGEVVDLARGEERVVRIAPVPREGAIEMIARDQDGQALPGTAFLGAESIGQVPGLLKVPICTKSVEVRTEKGQHPRRGAGPRAEGRLGYSGDSNPTNLVNEIQRPRVLHLPLAACRQQPGRVRGGLAAGSLALE